LISHDTFGLSFTSVAVRSGERLRMPATAPRSPADVHDPFSDLCRRLDEQRDALRHFFGQVRDLLDAIELAMPYHDSTSGAGLVKGPRSGEI
jgi:hypothetical protein